ncbi:MAG: AAA family ATPase, partial [Oscillospiraceae bacterium]|nr:AAA family ATPase [Oscillospiraceae bacterium]
MKNKLKLIKMSSVNVEEIKWIWYPFIPYGKVTIIQGDPGEGKTTFILALIALLTKGEPLPEEETATEPINVIYQTAEDGLGDTIKPRLLSAGADCDRVLVIDENETELTLSDERLEQAINQTGAKLIVLDPLQAYLGEAVDMHRANEIRPIMKRLALLAERTGCAVILVGHMNKMQGGKSSYRGLGSIDFRAAARSVLVVGRVKDEPTLRIVAHDKSSLAPEGKSIAFELNLETGFQWKGYCETTVDELLSGRGSLVSKTTQAENLLKELLADGDIASEEITER